MVTWMIEETGREWDGEKENLRLAFVLTIELSDVTDFIDMFPVVG